MDGTSFVEYASATAFGNITAPKTIKTGYAKVTGNPFTVNTDDEVKLSTLETAGSDSVFQVKNGLTATYTTGGTASEAKDKDITLALTGGTGAVVENATQVMKKEDYNATGKTLTWKINTKDMTSDITGVTANAVDVVEVKDLTAPVVTGGPNGLTVTAIADVSKAKVGETVKVTVVISGQETSTGAAGTKLTVSGCTTPVWDSSSLPVNASAAGATLTIAEGTSYLNNVTAVFTYKVDGTTNAPSIAIADAT